MIWKSGIQNLNEIDKEKNNWWCILYGGKLLYPETLVKDFKSQVMKETKILTEPIVLVMQLKLNIKFWKNYFMVSEIPEIWENGFFKYLSWYRGHLLEFQFPEWIKFIYQGFLKVTKVVLVEASVDDFIARWKAWSESHQTWVRIYI